MDAMFYWIFPQWITLIPIACYRCRTCRKRKTRCDGKRPLCSTCTENGHECLGYSDGSEGNQGNAGANRKDHKGDDARKDNDDEDAEEDVDYRESAGVPRNGRAEPKGQSYFDANPNGRRDMSDGAKGISTSYGDYRERAVFSDDGPGSMRMLTNMGDFIQADLRLNRSGALTTYRKSSGAVLQIFWTNCNCTGL